MLPTLRWPLALLIAATLEAGAIWLAVTVLHERPATTSDSRPMELDLTSLPVETPKPVEAQKPPPPEPQPRETQTKPPKELPKRASAATPALRALPVLGPPSDQPSAFADPAPQPPSPSAPEPGPTISDLFREQMRAAVQAAVFYPNAARILKLTGRTVLRFHYRDGVARDGAIAESSGRAVLDQAALDALGRANFPAPPPDLAGRLLELEIVVVFNQS